MIQCTKCFKEKDNKEFGDFKTCLECRDRNKMYLRDYRKTHKKNYCKKTPDEIKEYMTEYYKLNKDRLKQRSKDYYNNKKTHLSNSSNTPEVIVEN